MGPTNSSGKYQFLAGVTMMRTKVYRFLMLLLFMLPIAPAAGWSEQRIGVLLFSEEVRYNESLRGIRDQMARSGFREPKVKFEIGNAQGSKARAADLVRGYAAGGYSLMITLGTNATIAVAKEIHDTPIVFSMVFDPVEARVARDWKSSGNNLTGVSPRIMMTDLVARLKEIKPVKRLAVLYTPGEKNSESQLKEMQGVEREHGIKVLPVIISTKEDVRIMLPDVLHSVDAVYLSGSSVVGSTVPSIVELAAKEKVVTVTHLEDLVMGGVMLGVAADPYQLGVMAGRKAVAILKGAKPASIPIEFMPKPGCYINAKTARMTGVRIPKGIMQRAVKVFE